MAAAEFVRFAALAAVEDGLGASPGPDPREWLAPLILVTFRTTCIMATKMRDDMLDAGRKEELDGLVAAALWRRDEVLGRATD